jgi:nicotinamidase/pyrazinamidase
VITYGPDTALLIVDVQNDFADPAGSLSVRSGHTIIPALNAEIRRATAAGSHVLYTQDWHPPDTPHFAKDGGIWPVHCVMDTWGAALHPGLAVVGPIVRKGSNGEDGYSGFSMRDPTTGETKPTELADLLADAGTTNLVIAGLATDYCVRSTVLDAREHGYPITVLEQGVRAVNLEPQDGEHAIEAMLAAGALLESRRAV